MGESFGWSVSTCDLNGDGYDDLVVGAPTFAPNRFSYNSGRAHVFITDDWTKRYVCKKSLQGLGAELSILTAVIPKSIRLQSLNNRAKLSLQRLTYLVYK